MNFDGKASVMQHVAYTVHIYTDYSLMYNAIVIYTLAFIVNVLWDFISTALSHYCIETKMH